MQTQEETLSLSQSMEQTMEMSNLSVVGDIGEVVLDSALEDGVLKDIPIIGAIVGAYKCIRNIDDMLFTKKLIAFLWGFKDVDPKEREEAIEKWEEDSYCLISLLCKKY